MTTGYIKVKEWFIEKTQATARNYNTWIDVYSRDGNGKIEADENGYVTVLVQESLSESDKAVQVILGTGNIDGSMKGWKTWMPKSVIA